MSTPTRRRTEFHSLRVADIERLCDDAVAVTFDVPAELDADFAFAAGQSLTIRRVVDDREERRSYSICAPVGHPPRIGVREVPDGVFSTWFVREARPGDTVEVSGPVGTFTPDAEIAGHHVLIAAGSGITPMLSIAATVLANPHSTVTLLYGNRRSDTVMFADELADLKDRYRDRLELVHVLSREPREAELFTGRLDREKITALLRLLPEPTLVDEWWLCGPHGMVVDAQAVLAEHEVAADRIHAELFYVDTPPAPVRHEEQALSGDTAEVTVVLDGRATTTVIDRGSTVLDGAQRSRPDLPFACKGGVCGTCRAKVCDGEVQMLRNFALEEAEVAQGFVLTCQSVPLTEKVTVDFDE